MHLLTIDFFKHSTIRIILDPCGEPDALVEEEFDSVSAATHAVTDLLSSGAYPSEVTMQVGSCALLILNMRLSCVCETITTFELPLLSGMAQVMPVPNPAPEPEVFTINFPNGGSVTKLKHRPIDHEHIMQRMTCVL